MILFPNLVSFDFLNKTISTRVVINILNTCRQRLSPAAHVSLTFKGRVCVCGLSVLMFDFFPFGAGSGRKISSESKKNLDKKEAKTKQC